MTAYTRSPAMMPRLLRVAGDLIARRHGGTRSVCIVNYHRILETADPLLLSDPDVETFRWQMKLLADGFNVIPLEQALAGLAGATLPPRAVCITFDDGYRSTHDLALPVMREFGLPATVFIATGFVGNGTMWNDGILEALRTLSASSIDLRAFGLDQYSLASTKARLQAVNLITERAKYLLPGERQALIEHLDKLARIDSSDLMVTPEMICALAANGIEIGAHTISHPILTRLPDSDALREMVESKRFLEAIIGKEVRYFAYPNGKRGMDFDGRHVDMARQAGFAAAFTTAMGAARASDDLYALPRSRPWDESPALFGVRLLRWLAA